MKSKKKFSLILVFVLITAMFSAAYTTSLAVSQDEYDKAQKAAKDAKAATEAKRAEAKSAAKKAAEAEAAEAARLERLANPTSEDLLKEIRDLLKSKA